jgi:hypothetical protein
VATPNSAKLNCSAYDLQVKRLIMKKSFLQRLALILCVCSVFGFCAGVPVDANAAKTHHAKKHTHTQQGAKKKSSKKKKSGRGHKKSAHKTGYLKAPSSSHAMGREIMGTPDPNADEPSEMIMAVKNRAQDQFWAGKRPYPQQLRDQRNGIAPPAAPVLTGAIAQHELQKSNTQDAGARSESLRRVSYSDLSGVTFADQPLRMNASEAFRRSLDTVSFELGRPCKNQEYLGWPLAQNEQSRVDRIFEETNAKFKLRGYNLQPHKPRSVGSDVSAFTADRGDSKILGIWSAGDVGLLLLLCDAQTSDDMAYAAKNNMGSRDMIAATSKTKHVSKTKKVTKPKKKKTRKLFAPDSSATTAVPSAPAVPAASATVPDAPVAAAPTAPNMAVPNASDPNTAAPAAVIAPTHAAVPEARPEVIPGAPPRSLEQPKMEQPKIEQPKIEQPKVEQPVAPTVPSPSAAFIPADVPVTPPLPKPPVTPSLDGSMPSMKALAPDLKAPSIPAIPSTDKVMDVAKDAASAAVKDAAKDAAIGAVKDVVKP